MEWIRGPAIGRGATATVSLATSIPSGELFAVKSTELCHSMFLQRENFVMSKLSCPHIVKYIGYDITNENNKPMYNLCMEYVAGGTLSDEIRRVGGRLGEEKVKLYTQQILEGLSYLHVNGVAHCDIKSQNILIGKEGAKIADLGCAKLMGKSGASGCFDTSAISGTPAFMAPEVARGEEQGLEADIWALGCTIIEMSTGNSAWPELNDPVSALYKIGFSGDVPEIPRWLSEKGKDFLGRCLKRELKERWTAKELLQHSFLKESYSVKESAMESPNSVLDQGFWDSLNLVKSPKNLIPKEISLNFPSDRIKKLVHSTLPPASSNGSNWISSEDWITVRSSYIEESNELSFPTFSSMESFEELLETKTSIFDDDFFLDNSAQHTIDFSSISPFGSVTNHIFVSENLDFETVNEIYCSIPMLNSPQLSIVLEFHQRRPVGRMWPSVTNLCEQRRLKGLGRSDKKSKSTLH